jgi:hypothetical protein
MYSFEKQGGAPKAQYLMENFRSALDFCNLQDLGFEGDIFTWRNNNFRVDGYIRERLDRAVASPSWRVRFPGYKVINGDPEHSDHRPVIVHLEGTTRPVRTGQNNLNKRFEARWLLEDGCEEVVNNAWEVAGARGEEKVLDKIRVVSRELASWSREVIGDLQKRIKKLKSELEDCRHGEVTDASLRKEQALCYRLERVQDQWDTHWKQRAHVTWLQSGDRNTSYFHSVASERKRHNTIKKLKKEDGGVVVGEEGLQTVVTNYFSSLFTSMACTNPAQVLPHIEPCVTEMMNEHLTAEYTVEEVKNALDNIGDFKAPGVDGMPAIFYKKFWGTVGDDVVQEVLSVLRGGGIPEGWNETVVVLIPKVQNPKTMKDLRPISLCNVVYKLVSKVLANRLKCILDELC